MFNIYLVQIIEFVHKKKSSNSINMFANRSKFEGLLFGRDDKKVANSKHGAIAVKLITYASCVYFIIIFFLYRLDTQQ